MRTASAIVVVTESAAHPYGYAIQDGPEAGATFYLVGHPWWRVGELVTVQYHPEDQFAHEVAQIA